MQDLLCVQARAHDHGQPKVCVSVLFLCCFCAVFVLFLCCFCAVFVLFLCCFCAVSVLFLCCFCAVSVLFVCCFCAVYGSKSDEFESDMLSKTVETKVL